MVPSDYHKVYQKNAVATSNQGKLILMMYDGAIKFTRMALEAMDRGDLSGKGVNISKTQDIINELSLALNMDKGGEISVRLESLYRYTINQLTLANVKADRTALETVLKILVPLREAWDQIFSNPTTAQAPELPTVPEDAYQQPPAPPQKRFNARC